MRDRGEPSFASALAQYGPSLLYPDRAADPNDLLARLSQSGDLTLLEGFPVVLANALELRPSRVDLAAAERRLPEGEAREAFRKLAALSLHIFELFGLDGLAGPRLKRDYARGPVEGWLQVGGRTLNLDRVKKAFLKSLSFGREDKALCREESKREALRSLLFSPRQRDIIDKKLGGEPLGKTEREYFSRVIKKKLQALSDPDLQRMALKALG
jgi:hypothetical protein